MRGCWGIGDDEDAQELAIGQQGQAGHRMASAVKHPEGNLLMARACQ